MFLCSSFGRSFFRLSSEPWGLRQSYFTRRFIIRQFGLRVSMPLLATKRIVAPLPAAGRRQSTGFWEAEQRMHKSIVVFFWCILNVRFVCSILRAEIARSLLPGKKTVAQRPRSPQRDSFTGSTALWKQRRMSVGTRLLFSKESKQKRSTAVPPEGAGHRS